MNIISLINNRRRYSTVNLFKYTSIEGERVWTGVTGGTSFIEQAGAQSLITTTSDTERWLMWALTVQKILYTIINDAK